MNEVKICAEKQATFFACVRSRKAQLYSSLSEAKGENNEPGLRENRVNYFTCSRLPVEAQLTPPTETAQVPALDHTRLCVLRDSSQLAALFS